MGRLTGQRWRVSTIVLVLAIAVATNLLIPSATHAATSNCGNGSAGNFHDGKIYDPSDFQVRGAQADILILSPDLCSTGNEYVESTAWAMTNSDDRTGWAQVGYTRKQVGFGTLRYFWQWTIDSNTQTPYTGIWGTPSAGETHSFKVSRYTSDGRLHMLVDDQVPPCNIDGRCPTTSFDPLNNNWNGLQNRWHGETLRPGDDVAGTKTNKEEFTNVLSLGGDSGWHNNGFTGIDVEEWYFRMSTAGTDHFRIWTCPLDHSDHSVDCS